MDKSDALFFSSMAAVCGVILLGILAIAFATDFIVGLVVVGIMVSFAVIMGGTYVFLRNYGK